MDQSLQCSRAISAISFPVSEVPFGFQKMSYCMLLNVRLSLLLVDILMHIPSMQSQYSVLPLFILQLCSTWLIITVGYSRSHSTCACLPVGEG